MAFDLEVWLINNTIMFSLVQISDLESPDNSAIYSSNIKNLFNKYKSKSIHGKMENDERCLF